MDILHEFAMLPIFGFLANKIHYEAWKIPLIQDNQFCMGLIEKSI